MPSTAHPGFCFSELRMSGLRNEGGGPFRRQPPIVVHLNGLDCKVYIRSNWLIDSVRCLSNTINHSLSLEQVIKHRPRHARMHTLTSIQSIRNKLLSALNILAVHHLPLSE